MMQLNPLFAVTRKADFRCLVADFVDNDVVLQLVGIRAAGCFTTWSKPLIRPSIGKAAQLVVDGASIRNRAIWFSDDDFIAIEHTESELSRRVVNQGARRNGS